MSEHLEAEWVPDIPVADHIPGTMRYLFGETLNNAARRLLRACAANTADRNKGRIEKGKDPIDFALTEADFLALVKRAGGRCELTGIPFSDGRDGRWWPWQASVDRIDDGRGYTIENCRLVCKVVNIARNAYSDEVFDRMCRERAKRLAAM